MANTISRCLIILTTLAGSRIACAEDNGGEVIGPRKSPDLKLSEPAKEVAERIKKIRAGMRLNGNQTGDFSAAVNDGKVVRLTQCINGNILEREYFDGPCNIAGKGTNVKGDRTEEFTVRGKNGNVLEVILWKLNYVTIMDSNGKVIKTISFVQ